jgi:prophage regulatory protein
VIIRWKQLKEMIGISRSTVERLEASNNFPKRIILSKNSIGWYLEEIEEWIKNRKRGHINTK